MFPILALLLGASLAGTGPGDEVAVRAARARFNRAIAAHDSVHLSDEWSDDIHVIASRGNLATDRAGYRRLLIDQWPTRPGIVYDRQPDRVVIMAGWNTASEIGHWEGRFTDRDGPVKIKGHYLAQWRRTGSGWRLSAESFVAESCEGGDHCRLP